MIQPDVQKSGHPFMNLLRLRRIKFKIKFNQTVLH